MTAYICVTCGVQYAESESAPERCVICEEERQYVNVKGQMWTTLEVLRTTHRNRIGSEEPGLTGIGSDPSFAIGQRALLVQAASAYSQDLGASAQTAGANPYDLRSSAQAAGGRPPKGSHTPEGNKQPEGAHTQDSRTSTQAGANLQDVQPAAQDEEVRAQEGTNMQDVRAAAQAAGANLPGLRISAQAAGSRPPEGTGQSEGGVLWDCISLVDDTTVKAVRAMGGVRAMAISHPHFYSSMIEWSRALGGVPVYLHADDRQWVMRPDPAIQYWEGETHELGDGVTLIRCGGHFAGSTALHWAAGAEGRGALLTADTLTVVSDNRYVSFMYSYPNLIPLPKAAIEQIVRSVEPFAFDRIYGGWWERVVASDAKAAVARSAERYLKAISG